MEGTFGMTINLTWQSIITCGSVVAAVIALTKYISNTVRWMDNQKKQDVDIKSIKEETALLTYGVLACLKGLKEQGCDGPVTEAISKIEKRLNSEAHK